MTDEANPAWRRTLRFCLFFVPHLIVAPLALFLVVTFLHELAHAAMALGLGGEVTEFAFLPGAGSLGHMRWNGPAGSPAYYGDLVSVAPYLMWAGSAALVIGLCFVPNVLHWSTASTLFYWMYFVPLCDIGWNLVSGAGDLAVGGGKGIVVQGVGAAGLLAGYRIGFFVQRRLFGDDAVDALGYIVASVAVGLASGAAAGLGLLLLG